MASLHLPALQTPALLVDRQALERNVARMAERARRAGATLWPHAKTHKTLEVARLQREHGAAGLTAATLHEAELYAGAGFDDLLVAYPPVGPARLDRLVALARRARVRVAVDDEAVVAALDARCAAAGVEIGWLWELDCGTGRCGTPPGARTAARVAAAAAGASAAPFAGLLTFAGHAYAAADDAELLAVAAQERAAVDVTAAALRALGVEAPALSIGSTPTASRLPAHPGAPYELRPGCYVFQDVSQVALGVAALEDCALTVLATVISRPAPGRVILDCGSKALSGDRPSPRIRGHGAVLGHPELVIERLYEEHAIAHASGPCDLPAGARVRVVPNHACAAANLHAAMHVLEDGDVAGEWAVAARGWEP
jgi:D-serine deaminase-like pyridoxal phosphate-dependent protein